MTTTATPATPKTAIYQIGYMLVDELETEAVNETEYNLFRLYGNLYSDLNNAKQDIKALQALYPNRYYIICSDLIR